MTREEAHKILNRVREGGEYPRHKINQALKATGDIKQPVGRMAQRLRSQALAGQVESNSDRERIGASQCLVVRDDPEDREKPRPWCSAYLAARHEQGPK
jgi:hypothetical protein